MLSIALARTDAIVGVDTHKDQHVAVITDGLGGRLAEQFIPATLPEAGARALMLAPSGDAAALSRLPGDLEPRALIVLSTSRGLTRPTCWGFRAATASRSR